MKSSTDYQSILVRHASIFVSVISPYNNIRPKLRLVEGFEYLSGLAAHESNQMQSMSLKTALQSICGSLPHLLTQEILACPRISRVTWVRIPSGPPCFHKHDVHINPKGVCQNSLLGLTWFRTLWKVRQPKGKRFDIKIKRQ